VRSAKERGAPAVEVLAIVARRCEAVQLLIEAEKSIAEIEALVAEEKASFRAALERTIATAVDGAARLKRV
jgi:hypothetical protein